MPTFTTIALENLLEYRKNSNSDSNLSTLKNTQSSTNKPYHHPNQEEEEHHHDDEKLKVKNRLNHIYISPALYTTPEPTPILDYSSSGSVSSSPYVFNRKGRGGGGKSVNRRIDGFEVQESETQSPGNGQDQLFVGGGGEGEDVDDDFVDPRCDSMSVASSTEFNDSGRLLGFENMSVVSNQIGEFYDAIEDFSSDGSMLSIASCSRNIESELNTTKVSLLEEIEKRKTAENDLATMCTHWQRMGKLLLSQTGQTTSNDSSNSMQFDINAMKQFSEEIIVARFVAEAMGKAEAQAESELAAEVIIESKDKEILRLKDRLQYSETMIREMSQKNLQSMEVARRQRERKWGQRKWLWGCIGMSIVIGASVIAYSYAPQGSQSQSQIVGDTDTQLPEGGYDY